MPVNEYTRKSRGICNSDLLFIVSSTARGTLYLFAVNAYTLGASLVVASCRLTIGSLVILLVVFLHESTVQVWRLVSL